MEGFDLSKGAQEESKQLDRQFSEEVDAFLEEKAKEKGVSMKEVLKEYFDEYRDFLDNGLLLSMNEHEKLMFLKRLIYKNDMRKAVNPEDLKKAA